MNQAPTIEEKYQEKIKNLEEKIKFYENENQLQKQYIKSLIIKRKNRQFKTKQYY
jgi:hypothetical protein